MCSSKLWSCEKKTQFVRSFTKKKFKMFWGKLRKWQMFFWFWPILQNHTFLTLTPSSGYALNLNELIKVSKVSWKSQLSYEILRSSFERKFDKTNFISPKRTPPKSPHQIGLKASSDINDSSWIAFWLIRNDLYTWISWFVAIVQAKLAKRALFKCFKC